MRILGIDPGFATVGYGIVDYDCGNFGVVDYGVVTTAAGVPVSERLRLVYDEIFDLVAWRSPDFVAIEELFFNSNVKTAINVAQARGVLVLAAVNNKVPILEYTPLEVKQAVVGYGRAHKQQIQQVIKILLSLDTIPKPDDAADALAVAICAAHSVNSKLA